jgi:DNA-binding LacI/PurR family transcriptional regulator
MSDDAARRAPNMHDVAEIAGVSHQTVSRVLNGYRSIRPETRERVQAAIAQLGYRRNLAARALATSRTRAIGVLTPTVAQHGPSSSLLAVEAAARENGYHPLVTAAAVDYEATRLAVEFLLDQSIEALIVIAPHERVLEAIRDLDIVVPLVALQVPSSGDAVGLDQAAGARMATDHLIALGHRRIQHVSGPAEYFEAAARRRGVHEAIVAAGLPELPVIAGDWTAESGFAAAPLLDPATTAVVAANDQTAFGLIAGLVDAGRAVPGEVSVIGFDDVPEAPYLRPALSTVHQDFDQIGRQAVETVLRQLSADEAGHDPGDEGGGAPDPVEPRLIVRRSTAPPHDGVPPRLR